LLERDPICSGTGNDGDVRNQTAKQRQAKGEGDGMKPEHSGGQSFERGGQGPTYAKRVQKKNGNKVGNSSHHPNLGTRGGMN